MFVKTLCQARQTSARLDLSVTPDMIFQVTVSQKHPIKHSELVKIVQNMPAYKRSQDAKIRFFARVTYFLAGKVVRRNNTGTRTSGFRTTKRVSPVLRNV